MSEDRWDVPQTEEGLQLMLRQLDACREAGDDQEVARGLLALAFLVKWVRSDNLESPFDRSRTLSIEALEIARRIGDRRLEARAMRAAMPFVTPAERQGMLNECDAIAAELGDESERAKALESRARSLAMAPGHQSKELYGSALALHRQLGDLAGQARCLFGLAIQPGDDAEKLAMGVQAADLYERVGDLKMACRCLQVATMNSNDAGEKESIVLRALKLAQTAGDRSLERICYADLARIAVDQGEHAVAEQYSPWRTELEEAEGISSQEKWENEVYMTQLLLRALREAGNRKQAKELEKELRRLKRSRP